MSKVKDGDKCGKVGSKRGIAAGMSIARALRATIVVKVSQPQTRTGTKKKVKGGKMKLNCDVSRNRKTQQGNMVKRRTVYKERGRENE